MKTDLDAFNNSLKQVKRIADQANERLARLQEAANYFNSQEANDDINKIAECLNEHLGIDYGRMTFRPWEAHKFHLRVEIKDFDRALYSNRYHIFPLDRALEKIGFDAYVASNWITIYNRKK